MLAIPLASVPNQAISFNADNALWTLHIYQGGKFVCADVRINGENVIDGFRCFGGIPVLQYDYMTAPDFGNFVFDEDPDWTNFGGSCNLYYLSKDEMAQFNAEMVKWS